MLKPNGCRKRNFAEMLGNTFKRIQKHGGKMHTDYKQLLFSSNVFGEHRNNEFKPKSKWGCVQCSKNSLTLSQISPGFYVSAVKSFENTVGKGEIAHDEQFLLFPQCFLPVLRSFCHFHQIWNCFLQNFFSLERSEICRLREG